ncbi:MAG: hypothetical protein IT356_03515 [Gemmatimonadaceae bacterium]|nr:hypothetical protein [Gemmatimonadaceae bacterium]
MISETRERFIRSIAERIAPERILEAHFFPSIRQGQVETGVAVIAAAVEPAPPDEGQLPLHTVDTAAPVGRAAARAEVFTATYHWTRKGPDRGRWLVEVVAEAHAPIVTVEVVVRGVQERAGEALDAHRMAGDEVRTAIAALL